MSAKRCLGAAATPGRLLRLDGGSLYKVTQEVDVDQARMLLRDLAMVEDGAPWCGPCRAMAPIFARAAKELEPRARFAKVNVDEEQKSTIIGMSLRSMCWSKFEAVSATGSPGKSRDLQEPHTASAAGRSGATRLTALQ
jgi:thiol-disulfide isomerase/thioredoxin